MINDNHCVIPMMSAAATYFFKKLPVLSKLLASLSRPDFCRKNVLKGILKASKISEF
jgi:hypothetical protein